MSNGELQPSQIERENNTDKFTPLEVFKGRLVAGPEKFDLTKDITVTELQGKTDIPPETVLVANVASVDERIMFYEGNTQTQEQQKSSWKEKVNANINKAENAALKTTFQKLSLGEGEEKINFEKFTVAEAEKMYNRYFMGNDEQRVMLRGQEVVVSSNVMKFVDDVAKSYGDAVKKAQLETDLPKLKKLAEMFGTKSAEVIEQMIHLKVQMNAQDYVPEADKIAAAAATQKDKDLIEFLKPYKDLKPQPAQTEPTASPSPSEGQNPTQERPTLSVLIRDIQPIEKSDSKLRKRDDIQTLVEPPLIPTCERLYDLNICTWRSSANVKDIESGFGVITLDFKSLSDTNRQIALNLVSQGKANVNDEEDPTLVNLLIPITDQSTSDNISKEALKLIKPFKKQQMTWAIHFTLDEIKRSVMSRLGNVDFNPEEYAREHGTYYDIESQTFYVSEEQYKKSQERIEDEQTTLPETLAAVNTAEALFKTLTEHRNEQNPYLPVYALPNPSTTVTITAEQARDLVFPEQFPFFNRDSPRIVGPAFNKHMWNFMEGANVRNLTPDPSRRDKRFIQAACNLTDDDSALIGLAAIEGATPAEQAAYYKAIGNLLMKIHQLDSNIMVRWLRAQHDTNDNSFNYLLQSDQIWRQRVIDNNTVVEPHPPYTTEQANMPPLREGTVTQDMLQMYSNIPGNFSLDDGTATEITTNEELFKLLWTVRVRRLEQALREDKLTAYHHRWLETLSKTIDLKEVVEFLRAQSA